MKQTFLQFTFCLVALFFIFSTKAQVTIDHSNFIRPPVYTDTVYFSEESTLPSISEGPGQMWDYSGLVEEFLNETEHFDGANDPDIPDATGIYQSNLFFQFFLIENQAYEYVDEEGWGLSGRKNEESTEDISFVTGSAGDIIKFPAETHVYDERIDWVKFPMTYADQWSSTRTEFFNFELTVAAFGLNATPGHRKRFLTDSREVVGWGNLILPRVDGTPTDPMEVLLVKSHRTSVDSFFVGGAPAPQSLTDAFGLVQGGTFESEAYFFYKPGFGSAVLFQVIGQDGFFQYRPQGEYNNLTSVEEVNFVQLASFPNPISARETLTIQSESTPSKGRFNLLDVTGQLVYSTNFESISSNQIQVTIPTGMGKGFYIYQVNDAQNQIFGLGKILIE